MTMTGHGAVERAIAHQIKNWHGRKHLIDLPERKGRLPFITIAREYGCLGYPVALRIAEILNAARPEPLWETYDRVLVDRIMADLGLSAALAETLTDKARNEMSEFFRTTFSRFPAEVAIYKKLVETVRIIAANGHAIIVGRVGNMITRDFATGFHVRLVASLEKKMENLCGQYQVSRTECQDLIAKGREGREDYINSHLRIDTTDPALYDMVLNTTSLSLEETARTIVDAMAVTGLIARPDRS